jgi:hypothetical protein
MTERMRGHPEEPIAATKDLFFEKQILRFAQNDSP